MVKVMNFITSKKSYMKSYKKNQKIEKIQWQSPFHGEGAYSPRRFNQSASTRRAQLSVAVETVRSTDLLNHNVKT